MDASDAQGSDLSGTVIGEYQVLRRIGAGGMGVVYEGEQPVIGKKVAIKVLLQSLSKDTEQLNRFLSEARAVNAAKHRGIVDIFSFGALPDGRQYFVMEYLEGRPFNQLLSEYAPVPAPHVVSWLEEIVDALGAAHEAGVIHRDIKPSNLFLVERGQRAYVKVLDFGIAKMGAFGPQGAQQSHASMVLGTPHYMAPEQALARPVSAATDLYAVATVAFELLAARLPFFHEDAVKLMFMHVNGQAPHVSSFARVPLGLDALLFDLMAKDPAARPRAREVLKRLAALGLPKPVGAQGLVTQESTTFVGDGPPALPTDPALPADAPTLLQRSQPREPVSPPPADLPHAVPTTEEMPAKTRSVWLYALITFGTALVVFGALVLARAALRPTVPPPAPAPLRSAPLPVVEEELLAPLPVEEGEEEPVPVAADSGTAPAPRVRRMVPSQQQLEVRLAALVRVLERREKAQGQPDNIRRNYIATARDRVSGATTLEKRRDAAVFLNALAKDLQVR